jgi:hypothetical protein
MIANILQASKVTIPECGQFLRDTRDHEFLFGKEIGDFINEIYNKAIKLQTYIALNNGPQQVGVLQWFPGQMERARTLFKKYIDFRKP